ncbi:hypothetical protein TNIN_379181 [Trichonephila inaurata madagascariensis]|uniref:Uncharacterized protein n=1 Tax=Trichonephila inaurata madagascariensis TaxID=2747483 RepID=A0A8X6MMB4_9ARAC|nr:hypothetical protein TNIN_379181 [Trichonephila inaurata madagascariensis]
MKICVFSWYQREKGLALISFLKCRPGDRNRERYEQPPSSGVEASEAEPGRGIRLRPDPLLRRLLGPTRQDPEERAVLRRLWEARLQSVQAFRGRATLDLRDLLQKQQKRAPRILHIRAVLSFYKYSTCGSFIEENAETKAPRCHFFTKNRFVPATGALVVLLSKPSEPFPWLQQSPPILVSVQSFVLNRESISLSDGYPAVMEESQRMNRMQRNKRKSLIDTRS